MNYLKIGDTIRGVSDRNKYPQSYRTGVVLEIKQNSCIVNYHNVNQREVFDWQEIKVIQKAEKR